MNAQKIREWVLAAWGALLLYFYLSRHDLGGAALDIVFLWSEVTAQFTVSPYLTEAVGASLTVGVFCLFLMILGRRIMQKFLPHLPEELLLGSGLALGLGILSSVMALAHFSQFARPQTAWAIYIAVLISGAACFLDRSRRPELVALFRTFSIEKAVISAVFFALWLGTLIPEITYDPLVYHLAYPSLYEMHGGFTPTPHTIYAAFPQNMEMLYLFGLLIGDEMHAKAFPLAMACGLVLTFIGTARMACGEKRPGYLAALAFFSMPMAAFNVWTCFIDTGTTLFFWCALVLLADAVHRGKTAALVLPGLFCGWCMGTKYTAWPLILILPAAVWFARRRPENQNSEPPSFFRAFAIFAVPAALVLMPWIIRNLLIHHNPVYPFLGTRWGVPPVDPGKWARLMVDANAHHLLEWFSRPALFFDALMEPLNWIRRRIGTGDHIGVMFLFCLLWLIIDLLRRRLDAGQSGRHPIDVCSKISIAGGALLWLISGGVPRFVMPYLAPLFFLWACDFHKNSSPQSRSGRVSVPRITVLLLLAASYINGLASFIYMEGRRVLWGAETKETFLSTAHPLYPAPPFAAYKFLNEHAPKESRVLIISEARAYYLRRTFITASVYDVQPILTFARNADDADGLYRNIMGAGIDFILVNALEAERVRDYNLFDWDEKSWRVFQEFWGEHVELAYHLVSVIDGAALFVYKVVEHPSKPTGLPAVLAPR